jgi:hypothetical protein
MIADYFRARQELARGWVGGDARRGSITTRAPTHAKMENEQNALKQTRKRTSIHDTEKEGIIDSFDCKEHSI